MMPSTRQVEYCLVFVDRLLQGRGLHRWGGLPGPRPRCKVEALRNRLFNSKKMCCQIFKFANLPCLAASSSSCVVDKNRSVEYKKSLVQNFCVGCKMCSSKPGSQSQAYNSFVLTPLHCIIFSELVQTHVGFLTKF